MENNLGRRGNTAKNSAVLQKIKKRQQFVFLLSVSWICTSWKIGTFWVLRNGFSEQILWFLKIGTTCNAATGFAVLQRLKRHQFVLPLSVKRVCTSQKIGTFGLPHSGYSGYILYLLKIGTSRRNREPDKRI